MSYTNAHGQPQGKAHSFINRIREAIVGEIVAIYGYEEHIANSNMEGINTVWRNIMRDEKEHYGLFLELTRKYDPVQYEEYLAHQHDNVVVTPMQGFQPDYNKQLILNNVRQDIKGELEAVILYEQIIGEISYQDIKDVFNYVIKEEKGHIEHLTRVLLKYDPDKYDGLK